jgi:4-carboxymuconolactone decarboxylase
LNRYEEPGSVALLGYYALVTMTLNVFGMRAEGQETLPFAE